MGLSKLATVPSLLERQGNFSQSARAPRDPLTGQAFPGGIVPANRMSSVGLNLVSRFPLPDASSRNQATLSPTQNRDITETISLPALPDPPARDAVPPEPEAEPAPEPEPGAEPESEPTELPTQVLLGRKLP